MKLDVRSGLPPVVLEKDEGLLPEMRPACHRERSMPATEALHARRTERTESGTVKANGVPGKVMQHIRNLQGPLDERAAVIGARR